MKLGDLCDVVMGQSPSGESYNQNGHGTPLVNGPVEFGSSSPKKIKWTTSPTKLSAKGDIIFCVRGSTTGKMVLSNDVYCIGRGVCSIRPKDPQISEAVFFAIEHTLPKLLNFANGSTFMSVDRKTLLNHVFDTSLDKLVSFGEGISKVNLKINLLTKKKEALETYKKGLMQKIFSQELRFKREDGTDYPEWERLELIDVLDYKQPTKYIVDSTEYSNDYKTPVLTAGKSFILGYTDEEHNHFINFPVVIFDDFTTDFKYVDFAFKVKSSAMKILIPRENVNVRFVYDAMKTIRFPKGEHKRYWISEYGFMKIPYPSEEEQQRIASLSVKFDQKIDLVDRELSSIRKLKKGLLQQMFV